MRLASWGKVVGAAVLVMASVAVAADLGIKMAVKDYSFRYRMTVEVETPEGLKTGSAVRQVDVQHVEPQIQGLYETRAFVKGEAVVVDMGKRGVLFALLDPDASYRVVFQSFAGPPGLSEEGLKYYSQLKGVKALLPPNKYTEYTRFVWFKDIKIPESIQGIYPTDLESTYGKGVHIKEITVEMTDEPISWNIEKWLPWLSDITGRLDRKPLGGEPTLANTIDVGYFRSGTVK